MTYCNKSCSEPRFFFLNYYVSTRKLVFICPFWYFSKLEFLHGNLDIVYIDVRKFILHFYYVFQNFLSIFHCISAQWFVSVVSKLTLVWSSLVQGDLAQSSVIPILLRTLFLLYFAICRHWWFNITLFLYKDQQNWTLGLLFLKFSQFIGYIVLNLFLFSQGFF